MISIRTAGAKGLGVFAQTLIPRGTRIFSERPLLTILNQDASTLYPSVKRLSTKDRDTFMALSSFRNKETEFMRWGSVLYLTAKFTMSSLLGKTKFAPANKRNSLADHVDALSIFRSNSFNVGEKLGTSLFPGIARINHSCLPNAQGNFHEGLGKFNVHATRDIGVDEEVSLNYLPETGAGHYARGERLSSGYGFDCACAACDLKGMRGRKGEEKRVAMEGRIKAFYERPMVGDISDLEVELETMKAYIELYESEGIAGWELAGLYTKAVELAVGMKNTGEALKYAVVALELLKDCLGIDHPGYENALEVFNKLRKLNDR